MTEIVSRLSYKHRFQYVERRYFGFVALSFVVGADSDGDAVENPGVKCHKKYRSSFGGAAPGAQPLNPAN
jgi:hypothetical protein